MMPEKHSLREAFMPPNEAAEFTLDELTRAFLLFTTEAEATSAAKEFFAEAKKSGLLFDEMTFTALESVAPEKAARISSAQNETAADAADRRRRFDQLVKELRGE